MIFVILVMVLVGLLIGLVRSGSPDQKEIRVACAAAFRKPMEEIARQYEEETGVSIVLSFGGSGALASQLQIAGGDLFFPAHHSYLSELKERKALLDSVPVARMRPGLVVAPGNPKGIRELNDLANKDVRISLTNESAAIRKATRGALKERGLLPKIKENLVVTKPTVTEVVEDVALGAADVAIAWDAVVTNDPRVEWFGMDESIWQDSMSAMAILKTTISREQATAFAKYCADPERGGAVFEEMGFRVSKD